MFGASEVLELCQLWSPEVDRRQPRQTDLADVGPECSVYAWIERISMEYREGTRKIVKISPRVQSIPTYVAMSQHEYPDACISNPTQLIWKGVWRDIRKGSRGYRVRTEEGGCDPTLHSLDSDSLVLTLGGYCGWLDLCEDGSAGEEDESYQMHR
ncbi:hypothetical protein B0H13DRAFT_1875548 [Mycena leptocephala]|nr:hypothetical protein B0H13DRAFT_1875548 [Mycena leptocephala]